MSALSFCFESNSVRVFGDNVNPIFVATDVCKALQFKDPINAVKRHVDSDDIVKQSITDSLGRKQVVNCVNESGLYALIFGSKLASAKRFKKWVTSEVLPSIRKTGSYVNTISPCQQQTIKEAVSKRAKATGMLYSSIYHRIHHEFKIARYDQLLAKDFEACILFINSIEGERLGCEAQLIDDANESLKIVSQTIDLTIDHFHNLVAAEKALYEATREVTKARIGLFTACKEARLQANLLSR